MREFVLAFVWLFDILKQCKNFALVVILYGVCLNILNAFSLDDLQNNIQQSLKGKTLQGKFTQEKQLQGFSNVLKSFGTFSLINNNDDSIKNNSERILLWEIKSPIKSSLKITPKGVFEKVEKQDSSTKNEIKWIARNAQNQAIILEILSADFSSLKKYFDFLFAEHNGVWNLTLTPKNALISKVFDSIILQGLSTYPNLVEKVILQEKNGDKTTTTFSAIIIK